MTHSRFLLLLFKVGFFFYLSSPSGLYLKTIDGVTFKGHNILPINLTSILLFYLLLCFCYSRSNHDHQRNVFFLSSREQESHSFNLKGQFSIINLATVNAVLSRLEIARTLTADMKTPVLKEQDG